jgi:hypothetical protein
MKTNLSTSTKKNITTGSAVKVVHNIATKTEIVIDTLVRLAFSDSRQTKTSPPTVDSASNGEKLPLT